MSTKLPKLICEDNLSYAWGRAFLNVFDRSSSHLCPLNISITGFTDGVPAEVLELRQALDSSLANEDKFSCAISAATIFPFRQWRHVTSFPRDKLYRWYMGALLPRLKKRCPANQYGTYFERMIAFQGVKKKNGKEIVEPVNQLEHIISDWTKKRSHPKRPRQSALQVVCFDPAKDHTGQSVRGFPCLQQVSFAYDDNGGMAVNAFYPTQYIYDRAYGNYLGLCQLGGFMAHAMGLTLVRFSCFIGHPELGGVRKCDVRALADTVRQMLPEQPAESREEEVAE